MSSAAIANSEDTLTSSVSAEGRLYLEQTRNALLGATQGLTFAGWRFKPAAASWSIAENLEHIVIVLDLVRERLKGLLSGQLGEIAPAGRENGIIDGIIIGRVPLRLAKYPSPESALPSSNVAPQEALDRFAKSLADMLQILDSGLDLRGRVVNSAPLKALTQGKYTTVDGYQLLLTAAAHTERHVGQILEVRANPNFPAE